ncbi:response regulator [Patescibacteria group bacterium]|nr:response regulator [Patescibacteria group bacterium]MBU1673622.1 response regulator [Patescibacteria group bacterium]MBU1963890.1 response regulator [Patescibacteria group bacterium]
MKILLVEDDEMLHNMYTQKFKTKGYEVMSAYNGSEGVKMAEAETPDLILMDIIMPKMDGFVALKKIRKSKNIGETPVIILTNLGQEEDIKKGKELGADDYFIKANHTPAEVVEKVEAVLKKK